MSSSRPLSQTRLSDKRTRRYNDPGCNPAVLAAASSKSPNPNKNDNTTPAKHLYLPMSSSASNTEKALADGDKQLGNVAYQKYQFDEAIGHDEDAWEQYSDIAYKHNEATARYPNQDYKGAIAGSFNGLQNAEVGTLTSSAIAGSHGSIGMCHVTLGDRRKGVEYLEKSVEKHSTPATERDLARLKLQVEVDRELGDAVAETILKSFAKLPKKRKPLEGGGKKEWVPLAGIVAQGK